MSTTRRSLLTGLAALPAASIPTAPARSAVVPADPTSALIAAHRAAWDHLGDVVGEWSHRVGGIPPEFEIRTAAAHAAESKAVEAMLTPEPTTLAGLRALAEHMLWYDAKLEGEIYADQPTRWALATLAEGGA